MTRIFTPPNYTLGNITEFTNTVKRIDPTVLDVATTVGVTYSLSNEKIRYCHITLIRDGHQDKYQFDSQELSHADIFTIQSQMVLKKLRDDRRRKIEVPIPDSY